MFKSPDSTTLQLLPDAEASLSLDVGEVILDGHAVEAGPKIQVKAGNTEFGAEQLLHRHLPQALDDLVVVAGREILRDGTVEDPSKLEGVGQRITDPGPRSEQRSGHQDHAVEQA